MRQGRSRRQDALQIQEGKDVDPRTSLSEVSNATTSVVQKGFCHRAATTNPPERPLRAAACQGESPRFPVEVVHAPGEVDGGC